MREKILNIILTLVFTVSIVGITVANHTCTTTKEVIENCCSESSRQVDCCIEKISYLSNDSNQQRSEINYFIPDLPDLSNTYINFVPDLYSSTEKSHTRLYSKPSPSRDIPIWVSCFRL